jgi:hypothetical protein
MYLSGTGDLDLYSEELEERQEVRKTIEKERETCQIEHAIGSGRTSMAGAVIRARDENIKENGGISNFSYIVEREISSCCGDGSGW